MARMRDIRHGEYTWRYEKADLEQGAYHVADPDRQKVAVILPSDRSRPIEEGRNARLLTRDFGTTEWKDRGTYRLKEAMTRGNEHIHRYRARDQAAHTSEQIGREGLSKEERAVIENMRGRDASRTETAATRGTPDRRAWERIREAMRRSKDEKERARNRDGGRER